MSSTKDASERQRKAAFKAWETIRRNRGENPKAAKGTSARKRWKASDYPKNWKQIVVEIRERASTTRGRVQCECRGECLKHIGRCEEIHMTWARARRRRGKVKIRVTVSHLCHSTKCARRAHLRAQCEPCHLIYQQYCKRRRLRGGHAVRWAMRQGSNRRLVR
jgi:hypothetical protein